MEPAKHPCRPRQRKNRDMTKEDSIDAVRDWFEEEGYHCHYDVENECLQGYFQIRGKLKSVNLFVQFYDNGYDVQAVSPLNADGDTLENVMKYLHMANYGLKAGNFELDVDDGEIRFKYWMPIMGLERLPAEIIEHSIVHPCNMFERYGNGIAALSMGFSDPETEIRKAESDD